MKQIILLNIDYSDEAFLVQENLILRNPVKRPCFPVSEIPIKPKPSGPDSTHRPNFQQSDFRNENSDKNSLSPLELYEKLKSLIQSERKITNENSSTLKRSF